MTPVATHTRSARSADLKSTLIERDLPGNARVILELDHTKGGQQPGVHNRWHPEIPAIETIRPGEVVRVWTLDWSGKCHVPELENVWLNVQLSFATYRWSSYQ